MAENENLIVPNNVSNDDTNEHNKANVPNLRFRGYSGIYSLIKLKNVTNLITKGTTPHDFTTTGVKFIKIDSLDENNINNNRVNYILERIHTNELKRSILKENDILLAIAGATVGKHCIVRKENLPANTNQALAIIRLNNKLLPQYLLTLFDTELIPKYIKKVCAMSAQPNLNLEQVGDLEIYIPSILEQQDIVKFFTLIDDRIQAQSKIISDLEFQKKGLFDKLIKQNKSFWQTVKLGSILHERKTYATKDNSYPHATLSKEGISAKTDRYDRDFLVKDEEKEYKITQLNDICYNPANLKFGVICRNTFGSAIFSPIYVTYEVSSKCNPSFIELILTSKNFINYIRKYEQGTVYERMAVNSEDFLKGKISIPALEEQNKISKIFTIIDNKIQIEKDTLELYKQQKTYLLRNLFI